MNARRRTHPTAVGLVVAVTVAGCTGDVRNGAGPDVTTVNVAERTVQIDRSDGDVCLIDGPDRHCLGITAITGGPVVSALLHPLDTDENVLLVVTTDDEPVTIDTAGIETLAGPGGRTLNVAITDQPFVCMTWDDGTGAVSVSSEGGEAPDRAAAC